MRVTTNHQTLTIAWPSGGESRFHALWLRDNCPCAECRHDSGQRLLDTRSLPDGLTVVEVSLNGTVNVDFSDGHESSFDAAWLQGFAADEEPRRRLVLWGSELQSRLPVGRYEEVAAGGAALRTW